MTKTTRVVIAAVAAVGCGSNPKPAPEPVVRSEAPAPIVDPDLPVLTLIDAGAEPHRALRYQPVDGATDHADVEMKMAMAIDTGAGTPITMDIPAFEMGTEIRIFDVQTTGFSFAAKVISAGVDPAANASMAAAINPELQKIVGMVTSARMSRRGVVESTDVVMPPNAPARLNQTMDSIRQTMREATAPFPEEPVGIGARWRVVSKVTGMFDMTQTTVFELVAVDGARCTLRMTIEQTADRQEMELPDNPQSSSTLESMTSSGSADLEVDLARVVPIRFTLNSHSDAAMTMVTGVGATPTRMTMKMDVGMTMSARPRP